MIGILSFAFPSHSCSKPGSFVPVRTRTDGHRCGIFLAEAVATQHDGPPANPRVRRATAFVVGVVKNMRKGCTCFLIESDRRRRTQLSAALRFKGFSVIAVDSIAEVEMWPDGDVVVTDGAHFTAWWICVGAAHVIVLADSPAQGAEACARSATSRVDRTRDSETLLEIVAGLTAAAKPELLH